MFVIILLFYILSATCVALFCDPVEFRRAELLAPFNDSEDNLVKQYCVQHLNENYETPIHHLFVKYLMETTDSIEEIAQNVKTYVNREVNPKDSIANTALHAINLMNMFEMIRQADDFEPGSWSKDLKLRESAAVDIDRIGKEWEGDIGVGSLWNTFIARKALLMYGNQSTVMEVDSLFKSKYFKQGDSIPSAVPSVLMALNHGYAEDGVLSALSVEVAKTVALLNSKFSAEQTGFLLFSDDKGEVDQLASVALAVLLYRAAYEAMNKVPSAEVLHAWKVALNSESDLPSTNWKLSLMFVNQGDAVLNRLRHHMNFKSNELSSEFYAVYGELLNALLIRSNVFVYRFSCFDLNGELVAK